MKPGPRKTPEQRFWAKVHKTETCWLWTGARIGDGYGTLMLATIPGTGGKRMRSVLAHRFVHMVANRGLRGGNQ